MAGHGLPGAGYGSGPRARTTALVMVPALGAVAVASLLLGAVRIPWDALPALIAAGPFPDSSLGLDPTLEQFYYIFWFIRMPRVLGAMLTGAALAVAGTLMQGLFQNPLAGPDVLGVSAGASLGAVVAVIVGGPLLVWSLPLGAVIGSLGIALLIYTLASDRRHTSLLHVILAGMAVSGLAGGIISTLLLFSNQYQLNLFMFWTMGGLEGRLWDHVLWPLVLLAPALAFALLRSPRLDILALGEEQAHGSGLAVEREKRLFLACAAVLTGMGIAIAGPIGFIGLLVPHLLRLLAGPGHRALVPLAALGGALALLLADLIGRTVLVPFEIRAGIITSLVGGPFFLGLILRERGRRPW